MTVLWTGSTLSDFSRLEIVRPAQAQETTDKFYAECRFGDQVPGYTEQRSLWDVSLRGNEGDEWWVGLSPILPSDWIGWFPKNDELASWPIRGMHGGSLFEYHHAPVDGNWNDPRLPGSAPLYLVATDRVLRLYLVDPATSAPRSDATWDLVQFTRGLPADLAIGVKWSQDPSVGWVEAWSSGANVLPRHATRTLYPSPPFPATFVYPQVGLYRRGFIGDPALVWPKDGTPGLVYPAGFTPQAGAKVFPRAGGYVQSVQFRKPIVIATTREEVMRPTDTGKADGGAQTPTPTPDPLPATPSKAPSVAKRNAAPLDATKPSVQPNDGAMMLMAARDDLVAIRGSFVDTAPTALRAKARIDAINALLNKGPWTP